MKKCLNALTPNQTPPRIFKVFQLSAVDQGQQLFNMPPASHKRCKVHLATPFQQNNATSYAISFLPSLLFHCTNLLKGLLPWKLRRNIIAHYIRIYYMIDWVWLSHTLSDTYNKWFMPAVSSNMLITSGVFFLNHFWGKFQGKWLAAAFKQICTRECIPKQCHIVQIVF